MAQITIFNETASLVLNGRPFNSLAAGDYCALTFPNAPANRVNGANGSLTVAKRADGGVADFVIRVLKFGDDDVYLNSQLNQAKPVVFNGSWKESYSKDGTDGIESYLLENGTITVTPANPKNNVEGNAVMEYTIQFRNATRNI